MLLRSQEIGEQKTEHKGIFQKIEKTLKKNQIKGSKKII